MNIDELNEWIEECGLAEEEMQYPTGFEEAVVGYIEVPISEGYRLVMDAEKCIEILMKRDGMSREEAEEFHIFNIEGTKGEHTPVYLYKPTF